MCSDEFIEEDDSQDVDTGPYQSTARSTGNPEQVAVIVKVQEAPNPRLGNQRLIGGNEISCWNAVLGRVGETTAVLVVSLLYAVPRCNE